MRQHGWWRCRCLSTCATPSTHPVRTERNYASFAGYDFSACKPFLSSLPTELPLHNVLVLREALAEDGADMGLLVRRLGHTVPNSISVFFNPGTAPRVERRLVIVHAFWLH